MVFSLDTSFINQYNANVHMLLAEKGSKMMGIFEEQSGKGELHMFERYSPIYGLNLITNRGGVITPQDADFSRRVCQREVYANAFHHFPMDEAKLLIDPTSIYVKNAADAVGAHYDSICLNALLGDAATGKAGAGSQSFDANQVISAGGTGMTVAKINQALALMQRNYVDIASEDIYMTLNSYAYEDLLADSTNRFTSFDYMGAKPLAEKGFVSFRGIKLIPTERVAPVSAGVTERALMFTGSALKVAVWDKFKSSLDRRVDLTNQPMQLYYESSIGAVRMEEKLVIDIQFTV